jgi:hypothetical protein
LNGNFHPGVIFVSYKTDSGSHKVNCFQPEGPAVDVYIGIELNYPVDTKIVLEAISQNHNIKSKDTFLYVRKYILELYILVMILDMKTFIY